MQYILDITTLTFEHQLLFSKLDQSWLTIKDASITKLENGAKKITGRTLTDWKLVAIGLNLQEVYLTVIELRQESFIQEISAKETVAGREINWITGPIHMGSITFTSPDMQNVPFSLDALNGEFNLDNISPFISAFGFNKFYYQMHLIGFDTLELSYNWFSTAHPNLSIGGDFFHIDEFNLGGIINRRGLTSVAENPEQLSQFSAEVTFAGIPVDIRVSLNDRQFHTIIVQPSESASFPAISELLADLNLGNHEEYIDNFNTEINLLNSIEVRRILIQVNIHDFTKVHQISLFTTLNAFEARFNATLTFIDSHFGLHVELADDTPIKLDALFENSLPNLHFSETPTIRRLVLNGNLNPIAASFTIELADLLKIPIGTKSINLESLIIMAGLSSQSRYNFAIRGVFFIADVDLVLLACRKKINGHDGWFFETQVGHQKEIHLADFIASLSEVFDFVSPSAAHIPDISIQEIDLSFHSGTHDFNFQFAISLNESLGPFESSFLSLEVTLSKIANGSHVIAINLIGFMEFAGTSVDFIANDIGQQNWNAQIIYNHERNRGTVDLLSLCQHFDPHFVIENQELASLALTKFEIDYGHSGNGDHTLFADLQLTTKDNTLIEGFFSGNYTNDKWNIATGFGYVDGIHAEHDSKPEILKALPDTLKLTSVWFVFINTSGTVPRLPDHFPDTIKLDDVTTGVALIAELDLTQHHSIPGAKVLTDKKHTKLDVLVELTTKKLHIEASLGSEIRFPTKKLPADATAEEIRNAEFAIDSPSLIFEVTTSSISLAIKGSFILHLDGFEQTLSVELALSSSGIYLLADLKFSGDGWTPFGLEGMHIDELALELGIEFIPPGGIVGFMGGAHFDTNESEMSVTNKNEKKSDNEFAIVLEFVGIVPNLEYFALKIKALNLADILALFPGSSAHGHNSISRNIFSINDFELTWCESPIILPNGQQGHVGFGCHGTATIFGWKAYASLEIHPDTGIQGEGVLSPLNIGPLSIKGESKGKFLERESVGGNLQVISNTRIESPSPDDNESSVIRDGVEPLKVIPPGGACVHFNSNGSPYLNLSVDLKVLNVDVLKLHIEVTKDKLEFDLHLDIIVLSIRAHCVITNGEKQTFDINGSLFFGIGLHLDFDFLFTHVKVDIELGIKAKMNLSYDGDYINLGLAGSISFFGFKIDLGSFKLDHIPTDLKKLPTWLKSYVETGHAPEFESDLHDASGAELPDDFGSDRWIAAEQLLAQAKAWSKFVHDDIQALVKEKSFSAERILDLIRTIHDETKSISGNHEHLNFDDGTQELQDHLYALSVNVQVKTTGADAERRDGIDRMNWEMEWLEDRDNELRNKILTEWQRSETELANTEEKLFKAQENFINELLTEAELHVFIQKRDELIATIEARIKALKRTDNTEYPMLAIEHHNIMIKNDIRKALVISEIEKLALKHVEQIIERGLRRQNETPFTLNEI